MYHRYMPSANGQYHRQTVPERKPMQQKPTPCTPSQECKPAQGSNSAQECKPAQGSNPAQECKPAQGNNPAQECKPDQECKQAQERKSAQECERTGQGHIPCPPPEQKNAQTRSAGRENKSEREFPLQRGAEQSCTVRTPFFGIDSGDLLLLALLLLLLSEGSEDAMPMILTLAIALIL